MQLTKTLLKTTDAYIKKLAQAGINTTEDFLLHFPRALEDRSTVLENFAYVNLKEKNTMRLTIESIVSERTRTGKQLTKVILADDRGHLSEAVYFNKPYFMSKFASGDKVMLYGKAKYDYGKLSFVAPEIEFANSDLPSFVGVYSDANYIPGSWFADKMPLVRPYLDEIHDVLPPEIRKLKGFHSRRQNVERLHFPKNRTDWQQARDELAYEELFMIQYRWIERKLVSQKETEGRATAIAMNADRVKELLDLYPFELTSKQKIVLFQILKDMEKPHSMRRLLQGDVGTGKTAVAFVAGVHAILEARHLFLSESPHPNPLPEGEGDKEILRKENSPKYLIDLARKGRVDQTDAEEFLWELLRNRQLSGLKFRRQHPIRRYIADFFCDELWLVIELDWKIREDQKEYDQIRDEFMRSGGYSILRIKNEEIFNDTEWVLRKILQHKNPPRPLGEGPGVRAVGWERMKGLQAAFMAPTEILARQHFASFDKTFWSLGLRADLLVGSMTKKQKDEVKYRLKTGETDVVIGTHALLEGDVHFHSLGFVVIDEQHRFGVNQRNALESYSSFSAGGILPHVLNMTATPIPRTLALTLYGDQDLSILDEYPAGRKPIHTAVIPEHQREQAYLAIEEQLRQGRQVYWISPLVEESETLDIANAVNTQELLQSVFPSYQVGLIHGRMKAKEKDQVMQDFYERKIHVLSSTSVVEVGVDNPNATVIVIEAAERFGLSQLHQFRGRVGRGEHQSFCYLFTTKAYNGERLKAMERTNDGFELSEIDLELRGPGEVYGIRQSGVPEFKIADIKDLETVAQIREDIENILKSSGHQ